MAHRLLVPIVVLAVVTAGCGGASEQVTGDTTAIPTPGLPVTYQGPDGVSTTVESAARIVTLSGEFTETVFALGLGANVVAVDLSSVYPDEALGLPKIGVEFRLLAEPIIAAEPTVVIGDEDAIPTDVIEQVRAAGIAVVIFPALTTIAAPAEKIRQTAHVLGIEEQGEALATRVQAEIDDAIALAATAETDPRVAFVYIASDDTVLLFGESTVAGGLLAVAGALNVASDLGIDGWVPLTPEALVAGDPDVIVTASRGVETVGGLDAFLALPGIAETRAAADRRVLVYEDLFILGLAPRAGQALRQLVLDLHPELTP
ncbi:MAG: ABC transporter substrate-binding protein [Actinobacteria bacterium]|nr:ABC transporter substrate-binding protein [Actinomycetota bacterium]MBU1493394.1 ABC transporter substrate-binding protein [Actinomycetota bacterium]